MGVKVLLKIVKEAWKGKQFGDLYDTHLTKRVLIKKLYFKNGTAALYYLYFICRENDYSMNVLFQNLMSELIKFLYSIISFDIPLVIRIPL